MKKSIWQTLMPHVIAAVIFLIVALIMAKPALESGVVMKQDDVVGWQGMSHQSEIYKQQHGHYPLWVTNLFSGMPGYQIDMTGPWTILNIIHPLLQLGLPKPMNWLFLACICSYFLCQCLRIRPWLSVIGAVAFTYCSFSPIIISVGHETQMLALAFAPAVLASVILLFEGKYISGFILATIFTALELGAGHQQVAYYLFMIIIIMTVCYFIQAIKRKETALLAKGMGLAVAAAIVGLMVNAVLLMTAYDISKQSKRGGQLVLGNQQGVNKTNNGKTQGLSKEYAFQWSYGIGESLSLIYPGIKGYGSHVSERDGEPFAFPNLDENSNFTKYLTEKLNVPEDQALNFIINNRYIRFVYWGDQPGTEGPVYIGAVICALFILSMFYLKGRHKWWILSATVLGIVMAWGKNFPAFNYFLFDYLPLYNKFRAPTMALIIPQIVMPVGVALALEKLVSEKVHDLKPVKLAGIVVSGVVLLGAILYVTYDYGNENTRRTAAISQAFAQPDQVTRARMDSINAAFPAKNDNMFFDGLVYQTNGNVAAAKGLLTAIREDRKEAFGSSLMRSLLFILLTAGLVFLFLKKKVNEMVFIAGIGLLTLIDLVQFGSHYLNKYSFTSADTYEANEFPLSAADQEILKDTDPNYRVFNKATGDPFQDSHTSYYHKSIGGYHAAKLGIYDDLIAYQLGNGDPNPNVVNMLNTKYFIELNAQRNNTVAIRNPGALGNAWFVKEVKYVKGPAEEMMALNNFNPAETAIVEETFKKQVPNTFTAADSSASIKQVAFDNDSIKYESNSNSAHLAVFSEIYYKDWKAYIDGKPADFGKANYVLRAMVIPAGKHTIDFKFEPQVFYTGSLITNIGSWIIIVCLLAYIALQFLPAFKKNKAVA